MSNISEDSSSPMRKKVRALDLLDKHMNQRSKQNNIGNSPSHMLAWMQNKLPPPSPKKLTEFMNPNTSPTPKRRKLNSPNCDLQQLKPTPNDSTTTEDVTILSQPSSKNINLKSPQTRYSISEEASPTTVAAKSVAFSDKIESAPTQMTDIGSSPRPLSASKPSKSILRNTHVRRRSRGSLTSNQLDFSDIEIMDGIVRETNPHNLDFWVSGEIHSLLDINDIAEFKYIIESGIHIISNPNEDYRARRFEVYATFNNIIPVMSSKNVSEITDKKFCILIDNLETLIPHSIDHLKIEQNELLSIAPKKNPFISRLYVQIVRLLALIASNFKVMKWLAKQHHLQNKFKELYKLSIQAITNDNSNKVIIAAQASFLREEKFGTYFLTNEEIQGIILSITHIKEINSNNLIYEKLLLVKSFLNKYPHPTVANVSIWLPQEVLPRILMDEEVYSTKIMATAISVLLDLLKKCLDFYKGYESIYNCIEVTPIKSSVPEKFLGQLRKADDDETVTLGILLRRHIEYLIVEKKEYKLAMDLWLSSVALLFNSPDRLLELLDFGSRREWIELNRTCFNQDDPQAKTHAIKVWRIMTYCIFANINKLPKESIRSVILLLLTPFHYLKESQEDPNSREGLLYFLTGVMYTLGSECKNMKEEQFSLILVELISPIYEIVSTTSIQFKVRAIKILIHALRAVFPDAFTTSENKEHHPVRVIASVGVAINDITPFSVALIQSNFNSIKNLISFTIGNNIGEDLLNYQVFQLLLEMVPDSSRENKEILVNLCEIFWGISNVVNPDASSFELVFKITTTIPKKFSSIFFKNDSDFFFKYIQLSKEKLPSCTDLTINLLKTLLLHSSRSVPDVFIIASFLKLGDERTTVYITNWIGSTYLQPKISVQEYECLIYILNTISEPPVIDNILSLFLKVSISGDFFNKLEFDSWKDDNVEHFLKSYIQKLNPKIHSIISYFEDVSPRRRHIFYNIAPTLIRTGNQSIIESIIKKNPQLIDCVGEMSFQDIFEITPEVHYDYFIDNFPQFSDRVQTAILPWILTKEEYLHKTKPIEDYIFKESTDNKPNKMNSNLVEDLFNNIFSNKLWKPLNIFIGWCVTHNKKQYVDILFNGFDMDKSCLNELDPVYLAALSDASNLTTRKFIKVLKNYFSEQTNDKVCDLINTLIRKNKFHILLKCKGEFCFFLTKRQISSTDDESQKVMSSFHKFLDVLIIQKKKDVIEFLNELLTYMEEKDCRHYIYIARNVLLHPSFVSKKFYMTKGYRKCVKELGLWYSASIEGQLRPFEVTKSEAVGNTEYSNSSGVKIDRTENGIKPGIEKNTDSKYLGSGNDYELQVPATQFSELSSTQLPTATSTQLQDVPLSQSYEKERIQRNVTHKFEGRKLILSVNSTIDRSKQNDTSVPDLILTAGLDNPSKQSQPERNVIKQIKKDKEEEYEEENSIIQAIRIPIFNSLKVSDNQIKSSITSQKLSENKNLTIQQISKPIEKKNQFFAEIDHIGNNNNKKPFEVNLEEPNLIIETKETNAFTEVTSMQKITTIIKNLRELSPDDLSELTSLEKTTLRVQLLQFMLHLDESNEINLK